MKWLMKLPVLSLLAIVVTSGCSGDKKEKPAKVRHQVLKKESVVVVPESVQGKWKAVKVEVTDKSTKSAAIYTIKIGSEVKVPGTDLSLKVENFLPHFVMEGTTLTSQSNQLKNPAAELTISQSGREIYRGWLFTMYPAVHAFQHPQYGFTLVGYISS